MARDRDAEYDDRDDDRPRRRDRDDDRPRRRDEDEDRPRRSRRRDDDGPPTKQASVLGILALIGGIPSVLVNFIPCCGWVAGTVGGLVALILGIIGLVQANGSNGRIGKGLPLAGTILGAAAILISILWLIFFTVLAATAPTTPGGTGAPVSPSDPVAASLPAATLVKEFKDNETAADAKYKGKVVEVTGTVKKVQDFGGSSDISVELDGVNLASVVCKFSSTQGASVSGLSTGSTVTVRGRCAGLVVFDIELIDCIVLPGGPSKPSGTPSTGTKPSETKPPVGGLKVTAVELAKAFADDEDAANRKYKGKLLEVTGKVVATDLTDTDNQVVLLGPKENDVECRFGKQRLTGEAAITTGKQVTVRGKCTGNDDGPVALSDCTLVK